VFLENTHPLLVTSELVGHDGARKAVTNMVFFQQKLGLVFLDQQIWLGARLCQDEQYRGPVYRQKLEKFFGVESNVT